MAAHSSCTTLAAGAGGTFHVWPDAHELLLPSWRSDGGGASGRMVPADGGTGGPLPIMAAISPRPAHHPTPARRPHATTRATLIHAATKDVNERRHVYLIECAAVFFVGEKAQTREARRAAAVSMHLERPVIAAHWGFLGISFRKSKIHET